MLEKLGRVVDDSLLEISGAAWDPQHQNVVWVHEDSGNAAEITALDVTTGVSVARHSLSGHRQYDWEDMSITESPSGEPYMFIGDIGDNLDTRAYVELVRLPLLEPTPPNSTIDNYEVAKLILPSPSNAEALLVDPIRGDVLLATKSITGLSQLLVADGLAFSSWPEDNTVTLRHVGNIDLGLFGAVLAGDISPDGHTIVLRTPASLWLWEREVDQSVAEALLENRRCSLPSYFDIYGEAVAVDGQGRYLIVGEGLHSPIYLGLPSSYAKRFLQ